MAKRKDAPTHIDEIDMDDSSPPSSLASPRKRRGTHSPRTNSVDATCLQPHRVMTRSRARIFRFTDLPPEIRNLIYEYTFGRSDAMSLAELRLPTLLRTSRSFYTEARPIFFLNTPVAVHVRCNWCVRYHHLHSSHHMRYDQTGTVRDLPAMLRGDGTLPGRIARFNAVQFCIDCCCCDKAKVIATMAVRVSEQRPLVADASIMNRLNCPKVVAGLERMFSDARVALAAIGRRPNFNGLTIKDLDLVAMCFREPTESDSDFDSDESR